MLRRDRGALIALGFALLAIVIIAGIRMTGFVWPKSVQIDSTADWIIAAFTIVSAGTSIWAVIMVRRSLALNTAAVQAAVRSNDIAHSSFENEQRPWIALKNPRIFVDGELDTYVFQIDAENIGKTPAVDVDVQLKTTRSNMNRGSRARTTVFANSFKNFSKWKERAYLIFPSAELELTGTDDIPEDNGQRYVVVTYCVTYGARGSDQVRHTAGQLVFNAMHADNALKDGFHPVRTLQNIGVNVAD